MPKHDLPEDLHNLNLDLDEAFAFDTDIQGIVFPPFTAKDILYARREVYSLCHGKPIPEKYLKNSLVWKPSARFLGIYSMNYATPFGINKKWLSFVRIELPGSQVIGPKGVACYLGSSVDEAGAALKYNCAIRCFAEIMQQQGLDHRNLVTANPYAVNWGEANTEYVYAMIKDLVAAPFENVARLYKEQAQQQQIFSTDFIPQYLSTQRQSSNDEEMLMQLESALHNAPSL